MPSLLRLTRNETLKVLRKKRFLVVLLILMVLIPVFTYGQYTSQQRMLAKVGVTDWRATTQQQITENMRRMNSNWASEENKKVYQMQIEQSKYYLDHNINPSETGAPTFTRVFMQYGISLFLPLLVIVVAADLVSTELTDGTIKLLLTRPVPRWKILLSKYLTLVLFTTLTVLATGILAFVISGIFFGYKGLDAPMFVGFEIVNGTFDASKVQMISQWQLIVMTYGLGWFSALAVATLSFMISVLVRGTAAGMGVMLAVLIGGSLLVQLAEDFPLAKYLFTSHLSLTNFLNGTPPPVPDITMGYSLIVLGVWMLGALGISFYSFTKKDVLA